MGELETEHDTLENFAASGRAGRRNALPEIQVEINDPGAAKLAERLSDLSTHCEDQPASHENQTREQEPNSTKMA